VIVARYAHIRVSAKRKIKPREANTLLCKVLDQTFFKKFVGCGAKPHDLQPDAGSQPQVTKHPALRATLFAKEGREKDGAGGTMPPLPKGLMNNK
jgi:hypothetical protein